MNRRDVIILGGAALGASYLPKAAAQPASGNVRGAIVIGVDRIDGLATLSASKDADKVAAWLGGEGFKVEKLTDANGGKVSVDDVFDATSKFVTPGTFHVLVIYFAGHGFATGFTEWWMLTGAPINPNRAVNFFESQTLAQTCGIPTVVIVSDACRSLPTNAQLSRVKGGPIFPNTADFLDQGQVDTLKACAFAAPSYEAALVDRIAQKGGIFTETLMDAFRAPWDKMTTTLSNGDVVVKNSSLKEYLKAETNRRVQEVIGLTKSQIPDINAFADIHLSRVLQPTRTPPAPSTSIPVSFQSVANVALNEAGLTISDSPPLSSSLSNAIKNSGAYRDFDTLKTQISSSAFPSSFETQTGLSVSGIDVVDIITHPSVQSEKLIIGFSIQNIRVDFAGRYRVCDCLIQFADGNLSVFPVINGFITNVFYGEVGVDSVTFVPSSNSSRWFEYGDNKDRIDNLHAIVASASALGGFRIEGDASTRAKNAAQIADQIRLMKSLDPTLGIYAAYAYAQAGLPESVRSVASFMRDDLGFDFFDLAMLDRRRDVGGAIPTAFPFWPMLTQGWEYLRPYDIASPHDIAELKPFLIPSLWTTLSGEAKSIVTPIVSGRLPEPR
ncbi:MAG: caspase family protein [Mesorhizobium sp.]|nr:MAG: caspase family protein [Mesorhizobium sp.]